MIQFRKTDGVIVPLPKDIRFIEITDLGGKVGHVIIMRDNGAIQMINPKDDPDQCDKYRKAFGVEFSRVIRLPADAVTSQSS